MTEKQILTVSESQSQAIVSMGGSNCLYIDDHWFKEKMNEDKS